MSQVSCWRRSTSSLASLGWGHLAIFCRTIWRRVFPCVAVYSEAVFFQFFRLRYKRIYQSIIDIYKTLLPVCNARGQKGASRLSKTKKGGVLASLKLPVYLTLYVDIALGICLRIWVLGFEPWHLQQLLTPGCHNVSDESRSKFLTRVRLGQFLLLRSGRVGSAAYLVWVWKIFPKNLKFFSLG